MTIPKGNPLPAESPTQSIALFERARRAIPGGVNSPVRAFRAVGGTPLFISRGHGAHLHDVDGRRYLDFVTSWGALILGHARGVALLLASRSKLPVHEYPPASVKRAVGANGAGSKEAVGRMVCRLLKIEHDASRSDAFDALAVALCHLSRRKGLAVPGAGGKVPTAFSSRLSVSYHPAESTT